MICQHCTKEFPTHIEIDGIKRNLQNRKFCLECSPYNSHNTKPSLITIDIDTKHCPECNKTKHISEFYPRSNRTHKYYSYCRECSSTLTVKRLQDNKAKAIEYKGGKCVICGYNKCQGSLEFHHIDMEQKDYTISNHKGMSFDNIKLELDKCALVCRNCHGEIHANKVNLKDYYEPIANPRAT